ncbi:unnamed protein product [Effrenium voratum]|uniref:CBM20 domain-containing protein n=1 Tax=Effrenium voratum TaxID=2562239 RepID=A0AA36J4D8_9DINO|nr:unnamed protein product [Effrenium voratum]
MYRFQVSCDTQWGEEVCILGSASSVACWDVSRAIPLRPLSYPLWKSDPIDVSDVGPPEEVASRSKRLEYKYLIRGPRGVTWEHGNNRWVPVETGRLTVHDGFFGHIQPYPFSFEEDDHEDPEAEDTPERHHAASGWRVLVLGSSVAEGPEAAPPVSPPVWLLETEADAAKPQQCSWSRYWAWLTGIALILGTLVVFQAFQSLGTEEAPRYLYVSFHGDGSATTPLPQYGVNQVLRFDLEHPEDPAVEVLDTASAPTPPRMLRDVKGLKDGSVLVAQGLRSDSCILQYGPCDSNGQRQFVREYRSPILVHPYAMTFLGDTLYASTQDSGTVVGFNLSAADRLSAGDRINFNLQGDFRYRPGITYRGIASYKKCLYLSVTEMDKVAVICDLDHVSRHIHVRHPIGLLVDEDKDELYIASPNKQKDGEVLVWDLISQKVSRRLKHDGMTHPTNMAIHNGSVIVASQTQKSILQFNRTTGDFMRTLIKNLPDAPERNVMLSSC